MLWLVFGVWLIKLGIYYINISIIMCVLSKRGQKASFEGFVIGFNSANCLHRIRCSKPYLCFPLCLLPRSVAFFDVLQPYFTTITWSNWLEVIGLGES